MKLKKGEIFWLIFTLIYLAIFTFMFAQRKNYEFIIYIGVIIFFIILIGVTLRKTNFDYLALGGLSIWGLLHLAGGGLIVGENVLYALEIIHLFDIGDTFVLKFDQFVHAFGFGVATIVGWQLLIPNLNKNYSRKLIYFLVFCISMGLGALNEVVEFIAVVILPETGVGGYYNTALDIVFNGIGALIALVVIHFRKTYK